MRRVNPPIICSRQTPEAVLLDEAYKSELKNLEEVGNITVVDRQPGMKLIPFKEVFTQKCDPVSNQRKLKTRLTARGDLFCIKQLDKLMSALRTFTDA